MGVVYEAFDRERDELVALKVMRRIDPSALYRFKREFRALADISHPNLVALHELMSLADDWFFTMELIEGVGFRDYVRPGRAAADAEATRTAATPSSRRGSDGSSTTVDTMDLERVLSLGSRDQSAEPPVRAAQPLDLDRLRAALPQLARGLHALHQARRLHRDVKPSNVLVAGDGRVVLCDFGLVRELDERGAELTADTRIAGTAAFMSPEQAAGEPLTEASDWYSVGVILYEALTGRLPFSGDARDIVVAKQSRAAPAVRMRAPDAPADLAELCDRLLALRPGDRPTGPQVLAALGDDVVEAAALASQSTHVLPFVGRERELATLRRAFADARAGGVPLVRVTGSSGDGKSALLGRFVELASQEHGAVVLQGRCYARESVPYKAFDSVIDALSAYLVRCSSAELDRVLPPDAGMLSRLFPVLRRVDEIERPLPFGAVARDPHEVRRRAFAALRALLGNLAREQPVVVTIDDAQWGDVDSARLLLELVRPPDPPPLLVVLCYRSGAEAASQMLSVLASDDAQPVIGGAPTVAVAPLAAADAAELAYATIGRHPDAARLCAAIAEEAAGNAFFVTELARYVRSGAALDHHEIGVASVLARRLGELPDDARRLMEAVAVAGRPVPLRVVRRAAELGDATGDRAALAMLRADHLVRTSGTRDLDLIEAYHDRVRETVVAALAPDALAAWHGRLARAYESHGDVDPELMVEHWQAAGERARAAAHAVVAAELAQSALAFDRAARLFSLALELGEHAPADRRAMLTSLGDALASAGRGAEAADAYLQAVDGATAAAALELRRRAAEQLLQTGHLDRGLEAVGRVLEAVGVSMAPTPRRALLSLVRGRAWTRLRGLRFRERDSSQVSPETLSKIDVLWSVATGLSQIDTIRGADFQTRHLLHCLRAGEPYRVARGLAMEVAYTATAGGPARKRALALADMAERLAQRIDDPYTLGLLAVIRGVAAFFVGEWQQSRDNCARGAQLLTEHCTGVAWELASGELFMLAAMFYLGDLAGLAREVPERLRRAVDRGNLYTATGIRSWRTNVAWLALDDPDEAARQVELARQQWSRSGFHVQHYYELLSSAQNDLYRGDAIGAWDRVQQRWRELERSLLMRVQNLRIEALNLHARTALARAAATGDDGLRALALRNARGMEHQRMPWGIALALLIRATVAAARGDAEAAVGYLQRAEPMYQDVGMALHVAIAQHRRGVLLGGDEGRALAAAALAQVRECGAVDPAKMIAMVSPGFPM